MPTVAFDTSAKIGLLMLFGGMAALFLCTRALAAVLTRGGGSPAVGGRALAYFLPTAFVALTAMFLGRTEIATGVLFGTSVGAMTAVVAYVALGTPVENGPQRWRRIWPFLLAAALIVFVAGFKGTLTWRDAIALGVEGTLVLGLWREPHPQHDPGELNEEEPAGAGRVALLVLQLVAFAVVLGFAGWAVTRGAVRTSGLLRFISTSSLAATAISLALVLPMMYGSWKLATNGRAWSPVTTQVGVVLLNLCCLLPILILIPYVAAHVPALSHWAGDALAHSEGMPRLLIFPTPMWRVDNVILIVVGVLLLPVAFGKWSLGREEGLGLLVAYFFYLTVALASG